jgi:hypothetical protein
LKKIVCIDFRRKVFYTIEGASGFAGETVSGIARERIVPERLSIRAMARQMTVSKYVW